MAKSVVLGGNGFIGSHLVDALVNAGHDVTVFDRFSTDSRRYRSRNVREVTGVFGKDDSVLDALDGADTVFHFVSASTPASAAEAPARDVADNVVPTVQLLEHAVSAGVKRILFASTGGAIYGEQAHAVHAETDPILPLSPYAIAKAAIEGYLRFFRAEHGLNSTVLRISNPYGPRQSGARGQGLIPIAIRRVLDGEPVVRYGDGTMVRDYVYIDDLIAMIMRIVATASPKYDVYNLGSGRGESVNDVLHAVERELGSFAIDQRPTPSSFVNRVVLDTARFTTEFGTLPLTQLEDGIAASVQSAREERHR
ncbi:MAG TPA: NAD-dependent epimerase/dehydratase family protein [Microbacteriaceae bacterium]|nr:NAD-dependent epimerase/dehydratase family protein [Microbacteriaceae bacterium]